MKHNYRLLFKLTIALLFLFTTVVHSQNIQFTFENAQNINDGVDDYLEADVMIQTVDGLADFLLGSGQMYFNYNTATFGLNIEASGNFVVSYPDDQGYMLAEYYSNFGNTYAYGPYVFTDNTSSRVSVYFGQAQSSFVMTASTIDAMVTATPRKLFHIKIKYEDFSQDPLVSFEDNEDQLNGGVNDCRDQFYTAAGSSSTTTLDLAGEPGTQFQNALFDSSGVSSSVLATDDFGQNIVNITIYPNPATDLIYINSPTQLRKIEIYSLLGSKVLETTQTSEIDVKGLQTGMYLLKLYTEKGNGVKKIIIK